MKKYSVRMLTWLLALVMTFSGMAMAGDGDPGGDDRRSLRRKSRSP